MLKKNVKIDWMPEANKSFEDVKEAMSIVLVLVSPNYQEPFKIYSLSSEHSCAGVLTQKRDGEDERLISFMIFPLKNDKLNYPNLDKQSFSLVKAVKKFRHYIL